MASPVTYKNWSEVPDGVVLRGVSGDVAARSGDRWSWHRVRGVWEQRTLWTLPEWGDDLCFAEPAHEIARLPPGPTHEQIRAAVETVERAPTPGTRYATADGLPAGILRDADGDLLARLASERFSWLRTMSGWRDRLGTGASDIAWPVRWLAPLPADTSPAGLRAAAEAAEAALQLPSPGDAIDECDVPEGAVLLDNTGDVALRRAGGRCWVRVDEEWSANLDQRDSDPRSGGYEPYTYIGQAADANAARALVEAHERATAPTKPTGPQVGDEVPPTEAAWLAQAEPQPSAPPSVRVWQIGQPVQDGDWELLPVGAVVDSGDGSETPFLVRGPTGWGWASTGEHGIVWAEPGVSGVMPTPLFVSAARLVALNLDLSGTDFERDKVMRAECLRTLLELNGTHVDARGRVRQTPGATRAAPAVGDIVERWKDVPEGGVTRNRSGDLSVRLGDRRTWVRADGAWRTLTDWDLSVMSGEPTAGTRLVAIVPAPVTIERIRAAVGDPESAAAPTPPVLDAATECARIRAVRIAGLEGALAAAAARLCEVEAAWTVTKSGGIRWHHDGQGGQICAATDMPGEDRRAKRLRARALVAEHDAKRAVARAEHNRLADLVARTRPQSRRHLHVNGVQVEVTADTVLAGLAAALRSEGYPAEVRGGALCLGQWR